MVDMDELDRLHASLPELEATSWPDVYKEDSDVAVVIATIRDSEEWPHLVAEGLAVASVTILNAYPALAAELKGTRKMEAEALLALAKVADLLSDNGCDCECEHHYEEHDDDCERCFACRVEECFTRPIRDAIHKVQR